MVLFESVGTISYSRSIATMAVSLTIFEIFSVKNCLTLKCAFGVVQGHWIWHHSIDRTRVPVRFL